MSDLRVALIARADHRGLGCQTLEFYRHLKPERTIIADLGGLSPHANHFDDYPDRWGIRTLGWESAYEMKKFLAGVDVLLFAETPYWYDIINVARDMGVKTACHFNYEFMRYGVDASLPKPDLLIAPSRWHIDDVPGAVYLPLPVDRERCKFRLRTKARKFIHIAGHRTKLDRNGTQTVISAAALVHAPVEIIIKSQSPLGYDPLMGFSGATLRIDVGDPTNYWELYDEGDVMLLPRKFGGQSLPMHEAMSCGLPVIMSDVSPQNEFLPPECRIPAYVQQVASLQPGPIEIYDVDPRALATRIEQFYRDDAMVESLSKEADAWADAHSWETLLPVWQKTLEDLCSK